LLVKESVGRRQPPLEEIERAVQGQQGPLRKRYAVVLENAVCSRGKLLCRKNISMCRVWVARKPDFASPSVQWLKNRNEERVLQSGIKEHSQVSGDTPRARSPCPDCSGPELVKVLGVWGIVFGPVQGRWQDATYEDTRGTGGEKMWHFASVA
jgi:hypothetical protein